ncbi:hypothetical protein BJ508DRAFT_350937 [Ascobolus immersus RN42]|uniref:Uncharacterized protein n=1 Tax=Ascobolus immersus RN42 TaxID=1160509 RepID=A0A3N4IL50_ASCIM|nr:hypothetical protein BJ508DRAFT_350937 [Ascobolus immersus RN42]
MSSAIIRLSENSNRVKSNPSTGEEHIGDMAILAGLNWSFLATRHNSFRKAITYPPKQHTQTTQMSNIYNINDILSSPPFTARPRHRPPPPPRKMTPLERAEQTYINAGRLMPHFTRLALIKAQNEALKLARQPDPNGDLIKGDDRWFLLGYVEDAGIELELHEYNFLTPAERKRILWEHPRREYWKRVLWDAYLYPEETAREHAARYGGRRVLTFEEGREVYGLVEIGNTDGFGKTQKSYFK